MNRLWLGPLVAALCASCSCDPTGFRDRTYACAADGDCIDGYRCEASVCVASGSSGGGAAGGGQGGGAQGGGSVQGGGAGGGVVGGGGGGAVSCADAVEICGDEVDDNCNGILDDGCECDAGRPCYPGADGVFAAVLTAPELRYAWDGGAGCGAGEQQCTGGHLAQTCVGVHTPGTEYCDGRDTNCDGVVNLGCPCQSGRACYPGAPFTNGVGVCRAGVFDCTQAPQLNCVNVNLGGVETCNGLDDDCNGVVDDNLTGTAPCAPGVCSRQARGCADGGEVACDLASIPGYSATEVCNDGQDNNCNGAVDEGCACDAGVQQQCFTGPAGVCDGGACTGICRAGQQVCGLRSDGGLDFGACMNQVLPGTEASSCSNGLDDDCDGLTDCADSQCSGRSCGSGKTCSAGTCQCVGSDGGVSTTEVCTDGVDNTCDGLIDCADSTCAGRTCGSNGKRCSGTSCACLSADGGIAGSSESPFCGDGLDNDCDGLIDCADSNCANVACGSGRTCQQSVCTCLGPDGGVPQAVETLCNDGVDNDCDGLRDCADPSCATRACNTASPGSVCCSSTCVDLSTDPKNCGMCGASCSSGVCKRMVESGRTVGQCLCNGSGTLPDGGQVSGSWSCPSGSSSTQSCSGTSGLCDCGDDDDRCDNRANGKCGDKACYYP